MNPEDQGRKLNQLTTRWTLWYQAHQGSADGKRLAQQQVLDYYGGAIRRYLGRAIRDAEMTEELYQEFALRLVRGDLRGADPQRGRLRDFLKGVLFHLIADYRQRPARQQTPWRSDLPEPAVRDAPMPEFESEFLSSWRDELLARTWAALAEAERETGQTTYQVLHLRTQHPDLRSPALAQVLSAQLGKPVTPDGVRQMVHRAREKFADLLLEEVAHTIQNPTIDQLEQEMIDLGLLRYCRPVLDRKRQTGPR